VPTWKDVASATTARPLTGQVPGLDGARALATLSVFLYHSLWRTPALNPLAPVLGHADLGVEVFFVLSGFLVGRPLLAHAAAGGRRVGFLDFWRRRIARIWPAYLVALLGAVVVGIGTVEGLDGWLKHGLLVDSWYDDGGGTGLRPSWTLVVEVAFYALVLPLAALVALAGRRAHDAWVGLCVALASCSALAILETSYRETEPALRVLPPFLIAFAAGMLLAAAELDPAPGSWFGALVRGLRRLAARPWVCPALAAVTVVAMVALLHPSTTAPAFGLGRDRAIQSFAQVAVAFLVLVPLALRTARARWLGHPALLALGAASYGFYLWHLQVLRLVRPLLHGSTLAAVGGLALAVGGAYLAGELSRRAIEGPARRFLTR
jgi:peptidoglycan/LPS O-acetylase OafA/YrhL